MSDWKERAPGILSLADDFVYCFLVVGKERALLIDSGFGNIDIKAKAGEITALPITLVNTHGHGDHTAGNKAFGEVYAHPLEFDKIRAVSPNLLPVTEGFIFDLGGRTVEVLETPGHTAGGISLLVPDARVLFSGDNISDRDLSMHGADVDLDAYYASLEKITGLAGRFDTILCSHGTCPILLEYADRLKKLVTAIKSGELPYETVELKRAEGIIKARHYQLNGVSMNLRNM